VKRRLVNTFLAVVAALLIVIVGLLVLPGVVQTIPGRYRVALQERSPFLGRISESIIAQVAPVATALPVASQTHLSPAVDIGDLVAARPTVTPLAPLETTTPVAPAPLQANALPTEPYRLPTAAPSPTHAPTRTATPEPLPERVILPGMGVIRQSFNNCGPANLTQVLNWWGNQVSQEQVADYLKPNPEDRNVSAWQIADYVNEQTPGYNAIARSGGSLEMIKRFLAAGYPVVIEKGYELPESGWWGHYITVFGYDDARKELYSQDSYLGPWDGSGRVDSYDDIEKYWQQFNYTFYVVYTPDKADEIAIILGEEMFNDLNMWRHVAALAESETRGNPDDAMAWFNLGTALTRIASLTGDQVYYQGGAQAYDRAREIGLPPRMLWYQFQPYLAYWKTGRYQDVLDLADATLATQGGRNVEETYWYKGHVLLEMGRITEARQAYQSALAVNKNFYPAQISIDYIDSLNG
jgi:tetratricopeptide (TPR) repeat protein